MKTFTETLQDIATNATTTRDRAIVRARALDAAIRSLRDHLLDEAERPKRDITSVEADVAVLASYDREMTRLCQIPGVLAALLAEVVIEEVAP